MAYATQDDIIKATGADTLALIADRVGDGVIDAAAVVAALASASGLIDIHVGVRYPVPLAVVPDLVRDICVDIAVYKLSGEGRGLNDEKRTRYVDALAILKRIAASQANLDILPLPSSPVTDNVLLDAPDRVFTRDSLGNF